MRALGWIAMVGMLLGTGLAEAGPALASDKVQPPRPAPASNEPLPVPRWVSLKERVGHGRAGPDQDHRTLWIYQQGTPLKVIQQTELWRRVEDPDGARVWMHRRLLGGTQTFMVRTNDKRPALLRKRPQVDAPVRARLAQGVTGEVLECAQDWCKVKTHGQTGWIERISAYGTQELRTQTPQDDTTRLASRG